MNLGTELASAIGQQVGYVSMTNEVYNVVNNNLGLVGKLSPVALLNNEPKEEVTAHHTL